MTLAECLVHCEKCSELQHSSPAGHCCSHLRHGGLVNDWRRTLSSSTAATEASDVLLKSELGDKESEALTNDRLRASLANMKHSLAPRSRQGSVKGLARFSCAVPFAETVARQLIRPSQADRSALVRPQKLWGCCIVIHNTPHDGNRLLFKRSTDKVLNHHMRVEIAGTES
jgi:hypothetical protein